MTQQGDRFAFPDGTRWLVEQAPGDSADGAVVFTVTVPERVLTPAASTSQSDGLL